MTRTAWTRSALTLVGAVFVGLAAVGVVRALTADPKPASTLQQLMRSVFFINANVVFSAQVDDPESLPRDPRSSVLSANALTGLYGGWQAIENSGLALADAADLLNVRGRVCANGRPVPIDDADWKRVVEGLREAGVAAAAAARTRSQDRVFEVSDQLTTACANCHRLYRSRDNACASR